MIARIWSGESPLWRLLLPLSWLYGLVSGGSAYATSLGLNALGARQYRLWWSETLLPAAMAKHRW